MWSVFLKSFPLLGHAYTFSLIVVLAKTANPDVLWQYLLPLKPFLVFMQTYPDIMMDLHFVIIISDAVDSASKCKDEVKLLLPCSRLFKGGYPYLGAFTWREKRQIPRDDLATSSHLGPERRTRSLPATKAGASNFNCILYFFFSLLSIHKLLLKLNWKTQRFPSWRIQFFIPLSSSTSLCSGLSISFYLQILRNQETPWVDPKLLLLVLVWRVFLRLLIVLVMGLMCRFSRLVRENN